jgi:hypothetical protein
MGRSLSSVSGLIYFDERKRGMPVRDCLAPRLLPIVPTPISVIAVVWHGSPCRR